MNVSCIATTEGLAQFTGVVYLWDGRNKRTLFRGPAHAWEAGESHLAEEAAMEDARNWVRANLPAFIPYLD
jgi:hypothetical protein